MDDNILLVKILDNVTPIYSKPMLLYLRCNCASPAGTTTAGLPQVGLGSLRQCQLRGCQLRHRGWHSTRPWGDLGGNTGRCTECRVAVVSLSHRCHIFFLYVSTIDNCICILHMKKSWKWCNTTAARRRQRCDILCIYHNTCRNFYQWQLVRGKVTTKGRAHRDARELYDVMGCDYQCTDWSIASHAVLW
jgi:hypothetical protein